MDQSAVQSNSSRKVLSSVDGNNALKSGDEIDDIVEIAVENATHRSYHLTRWSAINRLLALLDKITRGKADLVIRFVSYLLFGGTAALMNLLVFAVGLMLLPKSLSPVSRTFIADVVACEVSLLANFIPNDYFTFRYVAGRQRAWIVRCARFHLTGMVGFILTVLLQQFFSHVMHIYPLIGQSLAIIIAFFYNFTFHHLFTYRRIS